MTLLTEFRRLLSERRTYAAGTPDHAYRTTAARKLLQMMRGVPVGEWR